MRQVTHGSTDISVDVYIVDATDGTPELGVLFNTTGIDLEYRREGAATVNVTEVTLAALTTAHTDGGFLEIGHGLYRFDVPDAAFASGAKTVSVQGTVTGMVVVPVTIQLTAFDMDTASTPQTADHTAGIADIPTVSEFNARTRLDADYFSWATDAVATVTNLTNLPSIPANWLTAAGINASALDGKGDWNVGKTGYSISGTKTTLDALSDVAATDIVSAGAITTLSGAVVNVDTVDTCTTNTDMVAEAPNAAAINAEVVDALNVDTYSEPPQGAMPAAPTLREMTHYMYKMLRNKKDSDGATVQLYDDAGTTVDQKQSTTESAGTTTADEWITGA